MKHFFSLIFILAAGTALAQPHPDNRLESRVLQQSPDKSVTAYEERWMYYDGETRQWKAIDDMLKVFIVLSKGGKTDTLVIFEKEAPQMLLDSFSFTLTRLGDKGTPGLICKLVTKEWGNLGEHGDYHIHRSAWSVWSVRDHKQLFHAQYKHSYEGEYSQHGDSVSAFSAVKYNYQYGITFSQHDIRITNMDRTLQLNDNIDKDTFVMMPGDAVNAYPEYCECRQPDHQEGRYVYKEGEYVLVKD